MIICVICYMRVFRPLLFLSMTLMAFLSSPVWSMPRLSQNDGLSNNCVLDVAKDSKGYLWFVTKTGADRYDGTVLKSYPYSFKGIFADPKGSVAAYTQIGEIYRYDKAADDFVCFAKLPANRTHVVCSHSSGNYLAGTVEGLFMVDSCGVFSKVSGVHASDIHSICSLEGGKVLLGGKDGIYSLEKGDGKYYIGRVSGPLSSLNVRIQCMEYDPGHGCLWIGTYSDGVYACDMDGGTIIRIDSIPSRFPVRSIAAATTGVMWIGTDGNGAYLVDRDAMGVVRHLTTRTENEEWRIDGNGIYKIFGDGEQVWICSFTGGINIYDPNSYHITRYLLPGEAGTDAGSARVNAVMEDSSGNIWFGTDNGISLADSSGRRWKYFLNSAGGDDAGYNVVLSLYEDSDHDVWAGGYAMGAFRIDKRSGALRKLPVGEEGVGSADIFSITGDQDSGIWFGGILGPLTRYDKRTGKYSKYNVNNAQVVVATPGKRVLVGGTDGLYVVRYDTGAIDHVYPRKPGESPENHVLCIHYCDDSRVLLGTEDGIVCFNLDRLEVTDWLHPMSSGKFNHIYSVREDNLGRIWFSTEYGVDCFDSRTGQQLSIADGAYIRNSSAAAGSDFIFGGTSGAVRFNPGSILASQGTYPLRINALDVSNLNYSTERKELMEIDDIPQVTLPYSANSFTVTFACLDFKSRDRISYRWRIRERSMPGEWSEWSDKGTAALSGIPSGRYTLEIESYVNSIFNAGRTLELRIKPPFYLSFPAFALYFVLLGLMIFLAVWVQRKLMENRTSNEKMRFFTDVAHEIRTPVTLIKSPLQDIESNENLTPRARYSLSLARGNADKLIRMVNQLLDFEKTEGTMMALKVSRFSVNDYIQGYVNMFRPTAEAKLQEVKVNIPKLRRDVWLDVEKMDTIMDNLLSNAVKYTPQGGHIQVDLRFNPDTFEVSVSDDGIGVPPSSREKLFTRFYRAQNTVNYSAGGSGIGLALVKNLSKMMHGKVSYAPGEERGSVFTVSFPYGRDHFLPSEIVDSPPEKDIETRAPVPHAAPVQVSGKETVMVVEDNDELREYICLNLEQEYNVIRAADGNEALDLLRKEEAGLVVSDILMPRMQGDALCRAIKEDFSISHIPVILLTAVADPEKVVYGLDCGADAYITKPFEMGVLKAQIRSLLRNRDRVREWFIGGGRGLEDIPAPNLPSSAGDMFLEKAMGIVRDHIQDSSFSVDNLCSEMAMSRSVLYKKLKALTGQAPNDFIRIIRLRHAASLLRQRRYSILEVAAMSGYPDPKYFSTSFKKFFGHTPSDFSKIAD